MSRGPGRVERAVLRMLRRDETDGGVGLTVRELFEGLPWAIAAEWPDDDPAFVPAVHVVSERALRRALNSLDRKGLVNGDQAYLNAPGKPIVWRGQGWAAGRPGSTRR
ncbi:MAG: hypothetical protein L0K86_24685 [Actinomycetia bacterium]|nr:hypothetical protein [Actinomycetes bacterium]